MGFLLKQLGAEQNSTWQSTYIKVSTDLLLLSPQWTNGYGSTSNDVGYPHPICPGQIIQCHPIHPGQIIIVALKSVHILPA